MLHAVMNGTETNPPPAPTMLDSAPIALPTSHNPKVPGNSRLALGNLFRSKRVAVYEANKAKTPDSHRVDMPLTICGPTSEPIRIPGASFQTMGHSTAPCWLCARTLEIDVNTIVAIDVATAMCRMSSGGKCS